MKQIGFQLLPLDARYPLPVAEEASGLWKGRIILVAVYERVGKSVIWVCERAQRAEQMNFMGLKSRKKRSVLVIDSYLNESAFQSS